MTVTVAAKASITPQAQRQVSARASIQARTKVLGIVNEDDGVLFAATERRSPEGLGENNVARTVLNGQDAYIWELDTQFFSNRSNQGTARANIRATTARTVQVRAKLTNQQLQTVQARARIAPRFAKTVSARAKIVGPSVRTVQVRANLRGTTVRTVTAKARIARIQFSVEVKASIANSVTRTVTAKAALTPQSLQKVDAKAAISNVILKTVSAKARVLPDTRLFARARILGFTSTTLEFTFNVQEAKRADLLFTFNATSGEKHYQVMQARARIQREPDALLTFEFSVNNPMPTGQVTIPTQRLKSP